MTRPKPVLLLILDGWGHREERDNNAIAQANAPNWRRLLATCSHTPIHEAMDEAYIRDLAKAIRKVAKHYEA